MKTHIALAIWLAASSSAWATENTDKQESSAVPGSWTTSTGPGGQSSEATSANFAAGNNAAAVRAPVPDPVPSSMPSNAESPDDPLPPPESPDFKKAQAHISPVSPQQVRQLVVEKSDMERAIASNPVSIIPKISALTIDLAPGASMPLVRTARNYPSSISFIDSTGAPWKLSAPPLSGSSDFTLYWLPNSPTIVVYANNPFKSANATVLLEGLSVPIALSLSSGEADSSAKTWVVDSRLDLRVPRRGPEAKPGAAPEMRIGLHDQVLQSFLDGVPPKDARRLKTTGGVPDTTVWQLGDDLYVRSRADIRDEFEATLSSADGTHLWKLPLTPYVAFSVMGRTEALTVALE